jgi:hypothetical protein
MRRVVLLVLLGLLAAGCGAGSAGPESDTAPGEGTAATADTAAAGEQAASSLPPSDAAATTTRPPAPPAVAALTSGRGDDGSLEVGVWFTVDPFTAGTTVIRVGTDADDSFPGVGDPLPHVEAWAEVTSSGVSLHDGAAEVASAAAGDLADWLSWTGSGPTQWFYFIQNVPVRAGTVWIVVDGGSGPGQVAGAPFGTGCSYHGAGVDLGPVPGGVPQPGTPCRYPAG